MDLDTYNKIFKETFKVSDKDLNDSLNNKRVDNWDSVTQLSLVTAIEDEFDIMLDSEDILNFSSYTEGKEILKKYEVDLD